MKRAEPVASAPSSRMDASLLACAARACSSARSEPELAIALGEALGSPIFIESGPPSRKPSERTDVPAGSGITIPLPTQDAPPARLVLTGDLAAGDEEIAALASMAGGALDRIHLKEQTRELGRQAERRITEVATLYEIGRAMDGVPIDSLLRLITERAARVMDAQACSLMRLSPDTRSLTIAASHGLSEDVVHVTQRALGEGIAGTVAQTGEPMLIVDSHTDPRLAGVALRKEIGSSMVVPMKDEQGRVTGVLSIRRRSPASNFDEDSLRLFSVFASQAALVISNAQLYSDLRKRLNELSTLSDLTQAVISTLDLNSLLEVVADRIRDVVKFDRCALFLQERNAKRYLPRVMRGFRPDVIGRNPVRIGEGVVGIVAKKQMPIVESDARNALQPMRGFARALGTNAFVAVPIISKSQTIGVIVADNRTSGRIVQDSTVELLITFAGQAGLAIENAQLYEDRDLRYQEMNRLATQTDNILRSIISCVVVVDTQGRVTRWNKAAEEMWSVTEEQAREQPYERLVERLGLPEEESSRLVRIIRRVAETGNPEHAYKMALHPSRRRDVVVNVFASPLIDRQGERQGAVQIMEDVTREIRMEAEMERIRRLADIGQLAAKMAHEVRNPLSSIKGAAQLMRNEYEDLAPLREFLGIIIDEVNGLSRLTSELLDFARPMLPDLRWVNINELVDRTRNFMASYLNDHGVEMTFTSAQKLPNILCDANQLEQVIRNIVINAVQAMPSGGKLAVSTTAESDRRGVTLVIADTGIGIPEDQFDSIFQPFVTSKAKGTGLGLAIVRKIVENHGGSVIVSSRVGAGTAFRINLPIRPMVSEPPPIDRLSEAQSLAGAIPDVQ